MSPELLVRQFELIAGAPNGVQKLRELIIQLAVRGKLVPQDPSDEPASVLLERIREERLRQVQRQKIGKPPSLAVIDDAARPSELPRGWSFARLGDLLLFEYGKNLPASRRTDVGEVPVYGSNGIVGYHSEPLFTSPAIIVGRKGSAGALNLAQGPAWATDVAYYVTPPRWINIRFALRLLQSLRLDELGKGIKPGLSRREAYNLIAVLPPLPEQRRIVAKVDELMALCDRLEARQQQRTMAQARLNHSALHHLTAATDDVELATHWERLQENFHLLYDNPERVAELRQAVLQLAVRGKLVPQDPNDEPASVLLERIAAEREQLVNSGRIRKERGLAPVDSDEVDGVELPASWQWSRLGELVEGMDSGWSPACPSEPTSSPEQWGVLRTTAVQPLAYWPHEHKVLPETLEPRPDCEVHAGDLLITRAGPKNRVGISCVVESTRPRLMISDKIIRCHPIEQCLDPRFIALCLNAGVSAAAIEHKKSGMAESQMNISQANLAAIPVALPPLPEQRRIVAKVDELMALGNWLEAQLDAARKKRAQLAASVLHQLAAA